MFSFLLLCFRPFNATDQRQQEALHIDSSVLYVDGFLDVFIMSVIIKHATGELWIIATCLGLGGGVGSCLAVYLHDKHIKEK